MKFMHIRKEITVPGIKKPVHGITFAYKFEPHGEEKVVRAAMSLCSNKDGFLKWKGRLIAAGRWELAWGGRFNELALSKRVKLEDHVFSGTLKPGVSLEDFFLQFTKEVK
jgi:hypothetical protein